MSMGRLCLFFSYASRYESIGAKINVLCLSLDSPFATSRWRKWPAHVHLLTKNELTIKDKFSLLITDVPYNMAVGQHLLKGNGRGLIGFTLHVEL